MSYTARIDDLVPSDRGTGVYAGAEVFSLVVRVLLVGVHLGVLEQFDELEAPQLDLILDLRVLFDRCFEHVQHLRRVVFNLERLLSLALGAPFYPTRFLLDHVYASFSRVHRVPAYSHNLHRSGLWTDSLK